MYYIGKSIVLGGEIVPLKDQRPTGLDGETYEMLRVDGGRPLFLNDHLSRFEASLGAQGIAKPECWDKLPSLLEWLVLCNGMMDCDVRLCVSADGTFQAGFIPSVYPTDRDYREGVRCELLHAMREMPSAKIYHAQMRDEAAKQQKACKAYESVLVDRDGRMTEGSRSNIFFVKDGELITAPDAMVLHGIMRKKVLELADKCGIRVRFDAPEAKSMGEFDGAFLSSTPMRILPIRQIGETDYNVGAAATQTLMKALAAEIAEQKKR